MPAQPVSQQRAFARTMVRTGLQGDAYVSKRSLAPLLSALCGIRGDTLDQAHLALAARLPKYKPKSLLRELQERHTLARTWGARGVMQILPTNELPQYLAAAGASPRWRRFLESRSNLSPQARLRLLQRLGKEEIKREALKGAFPDSSMRQFVLREAAQAGHILWKDGEGTSMVFAWTKPILGKNPQPDRDFRGLINQYISTYGPLRAADLGAWAGVTVAAARQLMAKSKVKELIVEGDDTPSFLTESDMDELMATRRRSAKGLIIVPPGDPLVMAYKTRWRPGGDDTPYGVAFRDGNLAARWNIHRGEITLEALEEGERKAVTSGIDDIVARAEVSAEWA